MTVDELRDKIDRLKRLLDNPEPGLFTWKEAVYQILDELMTEYCGEENPPTDEEGRGLHRTRKRANR